MLSYSLNPESFSFWQLIVTLEQLCSLGLFAEMEMVYTYATDRVVPSCIPLERLEFGTEFLKGAP